MPFNRQAANCRKQRRFRNVSLKACRPFVRIAPLCGSVSNRKFVARRSIAFPCYKVVPIVWKNITNATQSDGGGRGWQEKRTPLSSASLGWQSALTEDKGVASACPSAPSDERGGMPPVLTAAPQDAQRRAGAASEVSGRAMKKVEPSPSTDSNQMRPPCCSTRAWQR